MKIKSIQQICKGAKRIELYTGEGEVQWISEGGAYYPLYNLPALDEESVLTLFDIPESKREKIRMEIRHALPQCLSIADRDSSERLLEQGHITVCVHGRVMLPLQTSHGTVYINSKYMMPFSDIEAGVQLYERHTASGALYIAVKEGFLLTGIILPQDIITNEFVKELQALHEGTEASFEHKKGLYIDSASDAEQIEFDE